MLKTNCIKSNKGKSNRPVGRTVTSSSLDWEVSSSNLRMVESDTELSTARHRCGISLKGAMLPRPNYADP